MIAVGGLVAGGLAAIAFGATGASSRAIPGCDAVRGRPGALVTMWIEAQQQEAPAVCRLTAPAYRPSKQSFGRFQVALAHRLEAASQPGHRLYLILLLGTERTGRYLLDLRRDRNRRWLVDLWAEL